MGHKVDNSRPSPIEAIRLSRRSVLKRGAALGLSAPAIAALLAACGGSSSTSSSTGNSSTSSSSSAATVPAQPAATPGSAAPSPSVAESGGKAGGGGELNILWWQAPTTLNAHLSLAGANSGAIRIYAEPLADFNAQNQLVPFLAAEIPSVDNGGIAKDGTSVIWKLRQGVTWHDGTPFTAKDVAFTYQYLSDPQTSATTIGYYQDVAKVEATDDYTVTITFKHPTAPWYNPFTGAAGQILPAHILQDYVGTKAQTAPFNIKPIGTGPFKVATFTPGDVVTFDINAAYYVAGLPHFDRVVLKGGGDAASAGRAVMQTGEADWAWNLQVEPAVLQAMESAGLGKLVTWPGGGTEKLVINHSDPLKETDGQKSYYKNPHPHFKELKVRQALNLAIQRDVMAKTLYGSAGQATGYTLNNNPRYMPKGVSWEFNLDKAKQLLDEAGAKPGSDGIRVLNGQKMSWVYTASTNSVRQKEQQIIKAALQKLGIEVEIQSIEAGVYYNALNPKSFQHLYCDLGMESNTPGIFPILWYLRYLSANPDSDVAQRENQWSGRNIQRYINDDFNTLWQQASTEIDEEKYTETFLKMQSHVLDNVADIGMVARNNIAAASKKLEGYDPTPWTVDVWDIRNWRKSS